MKKFGTLLVAAILGSALTFGTYALFFDNNETVRIEHQMSNPVKLANGQSLNSGDTDFTYAAEKVTPSVVHIKSTKQGQYYSNTFRDPFRDFFGDDFFYFFDPRPQKSPDQVSTGSGVIISQNGYIVTNNHVVAFADAIEVSLHDNRTFTATVVGADPSTDLALLKIEAENLNNIQFANSDEVKVGQWVLAVGNPFNLTSTVTAGIVSAKGRNLQILDDRSAIESFIQTDAAVNPGNSGGALVNLEGGLVGINTAIASPTGAYAGYAFSIPSNIVEKVVQDLLEYGVVQRGFLGVIIRNVDGNLAKEFDLTVTEGVYVDSIVKDGAAQLAGVKHGDVIVSVNNVKVKTVPELQEIVGRHRPGDNLALVVIRGKESKNLTVTLKNQEGNTDVVKKTEADVLQVLGLELEEADTKDLKKLGLEQGVRVVKIKPGKIAQHTNMKEGFIIIRIDGKPVGTPTEVAELLENKKGGVMIEGVYPGYPTLYYYAFGL